MSTKNNSDKKINVKKVYIRKRNKYIALSFEEFSRRKENTYLYQKKKFIVVQGNLLEVTAKIYADYYKEEDHSRYLKRMTKGSIAFSLDALENKEKIIESALITDELAEEIEKKMTLSGYEFPNANAYTDVQYINAKFPEFGYRSGDGYSRTLFKDDYDQWQFRNNGNYGSVHFIPLYYPDGDYYVSFEKSDLWTPAGMIKGEMLSNPLVIEGNAYNDWYIGR